MYKSFLAVVPKPKAGSALEEAVLPQAVAKAILSVVPKGDIITLGLTPTFEGASLATAATQPIERRPTLHKMEPLEQQRPRYASKEQESIAIRQQRESGAGDLFASYHFLTI